MAINQSKTEATIIEACEINPDTVQSLRVILAKMNTSHYILFIEGYKDSKVKQYEQLGTARFFKDEQKAVNEYKILVESLRSGKVI